MYLFFTVAFIIWKILIPKKKWADSKRHFGHFRTTSIKQHDQKQTKKEGNQD